MLVDFWNLIMGRSVQPAKAPHDESRAAAIKKLDDALRASETTSLELKRLTETEKTLQGISHVR